MTDGGRTVYEWVHNRNDVDTNNYFVHGVPSKSGVTHYTLYKRDTLESVYLFSDETLYPLQQGNPYPHFPYAVCMVKKAHSSKEVESRYWACFLNSGQMIYVGPDK
jgi:hypothetical protein